MGHKVDDSTIYRVLNRQGWRKPGGGVKATSHPATPPESTGAQENPVPMHKRRKQPLPSTGTRERSFRCYPSDLTDQEWAILEPLIPPAKEGGRPRTTEMRDVLGALFYVDRDFMPMASVAARLPCMVHRLELFSHLARRWHLATHAYGLA